MPFFSFIVPVYNVRRFLPACVESVTAQAFHDVEVILVDDVSSDGSSELCDRLAAQDARIQVIHLARNSGPGTARNEGMKAASGEYLFCLDGDDLIAKGAMARLHAAILRQGSPDMVHVRHNEFFGERPEPPAPDETAESVNSVEAFLRPTLDHPRVGFQVWQFALRRAWVKEAGVAFGEARICEDNDFMLRLLVQARSIGLLGGIFYHWRMRLSGSLTSAHAKGWNHIVASAAAMLNFVCSRSLPELLRRWALLNVHSILLQFEDVAGAVRTEDLDGHPGLFDPFEQHLDVMAPHVHESGLLWHIRAQGALHGARSYCAGKAEVLRNLMQGAGTRALYGFPATRRCSRLLDVLGAQGYAFQGLLDNSADKQGLIMDGRPILKPAILSLCHGEGEVFVVISTFRRSTARVLAEQLQGLGLMEGEDFVYGEFESE
jgi:glycosyltransferase involved in cell wall biosynthesis